MSELHRSSASTHSSRSPSFTAPPDQNATLNRVRSCGLKTVRCWARFQVELHGRFSVQYVERAREYCQRTSSSRILLACLVTPLPALAAITLVDCAPLAPLKNGTHGNLMYWVRLVVVITIMVCGRLQQFRCCLPRLQLQVYHVVFVAFIAAVSGTAFVYGLSTVIGFPVPFAQVTASITGLPTAIFTMGMILREKLRQDTTLQTHLRNQFFVFVGETAMTYVYPIYFLAFTSTASYAQSAITFLLPFLKIGLRNHFSKALTGLDDVKPSFIVFNVDIFSAMYVAICMQTSHYWVNTLLIMVVDIVQILISVYDVRRVLKEIRALVNLDKYDGSLLDLCLTIASAPEVRRELDHQCSSHKLGKSRNRQGALQSAGRIVPSLSASRPSMTIIHKNTIIAKLRPSKRVKLAHKLMSVLYIAEFVLLIEFAEVMIPILYSIYLVAMSYLPNRQHYDQLATLTEDELVSSILSVMLNAGLEFLSFFSICWLLGRELRLKSLHLVGFSLEHHRHTIIPILTSWVTYVIQQSLNHNGADLSFRFAWLHSRSQQS